MLYGNAQFPVSYNRGAQRSPTAETLPLELFWTRGSLGDRVGQIADPAAPPRHVRRYLPSSPARTGRRGCHREAKREGRRLTNPRQKALCRGCDRAPLRVRAPPARCAQVDAEQTFPVSPLGSNRSSSPQQTRRTLEFPLPRVPPAPYHAEDLAGAPDRCRTDIYWTVTSHRLDAGLHPVRARRSWRPRLEGRELPQGFHARLRQVRPRPSPALQYTSF